MKDESAKAITSIIEEARDQARAAIAEAYPQALEVEDVTKGMYEFDAVIIDDEECEIAEVAIMHDYEANVYALVERIRPDEELIREAEREMRVGDLLQQIELKVMMLSMLCDTEDGLAAAWAAVDATASQSFRLRLREMGADVDAVMRKVDRFMLFNPQ